VRGGREMAQVDLTAVPELRERVRVLVERVDALGRHL
jgi:hypothetical protein